MTSIAGITFNIESKYTIQEYLGMGSYGAVVSALRKSDNKQVAVKKICQIENQIDAKTVLREILILNSLKHQNILELLDIYYDNTNKNKFGDIYLVTDLYEANLSKIIISGQLLTDDHFKFILYQLLKSLKYLHSANITHRDIKPLNILANQNCEVCLCDFGMARQIEQIEEQDDQFSLTEYVATRYYRAPEIMLSSHDYTMAIDIWALGCTFADMITKEVLFPGNNYIKMIKLIFERLGKPDNLEFIQNKNARQFIDLQNFQQKKSISQSIQYNNPLALDLLDKMLQIDPTIRITATEALKHPYLEDFRDEIEEIESAGKINFSFENDNNITYEKLKTLILEEVNQFRIKNKEEKINIQQEISKGKKNKK